MNVVRVSLVIWLIVAGAVALGLYQVTYEVQHLEEELHQVRNQIRQDRVALHVLEAEWAHLNRPERLRHLASKHLDMRPTSATQVAAVTALPPRISRSKQAMRHASADAGGDPAMPLPRSKPWSLEQPMYARAGTRSAQTDRARGDGSRGEGSRGEGAQTPLPRAGAQVADRRQPARQNVDAVRKHTALAAPTDTAGHVVGQSDRSKGPKAQASLPRSGPPKRRQIAVGDVLIQVGARP